jgi:hypothetical protein
VSRVVATILATSLTVFLATSVARAEAPRPPVESKRAAQAHLDRGNELFTHDQFQQALDEFTAAFTLFPSPKLRFNLGQCERALGHGAAATEQFRRFLDEVQDVPPALRAEAERYLAEPPEVPMKVDPKPDTAPPVAPPLPAPSPIAPPPLARAAAPPPLALIAPPPAASAPPPSRSVLHRWWFWTAVGVVVAAGAVTTYLLARPRDPECDKPMMCL